MIMSGAAPLGADLEAACRSARRAARLQQGYGLTEASPVTHSRRSERPHTPGTIGKLFPTPRPAWSTSSTARDAEPGAPGRALGARAAGDARLSRRRSGRRRRARSTPTAGCARATSPRSTRHGGWRIVDRLKELIKYKGYQVPPAMLEALLLTHPAVADACVVPVADEEAGEIPKAFVVARAGRSAATS